MRSHARTRFDQGRSNTRFEQFEQTVPEVTEWKRRLDDMKRIALEYARENNVLNVGK